MEARKIAVFDPNHKLIAVASGISQLARIMDVGTGALLRALNGERICCNSLYLRYIPEELIIDIDDIGNVDLLDFDLEYRNEDRYVYTTRSQKKSGIILESEFAKIRENKYKHYTFKRKKNESSRD